jgi:hypothetical protein
MTNVPETLGTVAFDRVRSTHLLGRAPTKGEYGVSFSEHQLGSLIGTAVHKKAKR